MGMGPDLGDLSGIVATAWQQALGRDGPDRGRSFLVEGGDSLRAAVLRAQLAEQLGRELSISEVLTARSLAALTQLLLARAPRATVAPRDLTPAADPCSRLTFAQERMWFLHELTSATAAYHVTQALRFRGPFDPDAMQAAFDALSGRHAVLRAAVMSRGGAPYPVAGAAEVPTLRIVALDTASHDTLATLDEFLLEFVNAPFHLTRGPLMRAAVIRLGDDDTVMVLAMHHIVADQWSLDILWRDLAEAYGQAVIGTPITFSASAPILAEYAQAERDRFRPDRRDAELAYWRERLRGLQPIELNSDFLRPPAQSFRGSRLRVDFGLREIATLRGVAAERGASLAALLLAALKVQLHRHTGRSDLAVGMPVANRPDVRAQSLVGTLINTLVIRSDPLSDLRRRAATRGYVLTEALEHQQLPSRCWCSRSTCRGIPAVRRCSR
ncbi:MAG: condensation domain-containing protein [Steroidobacteraceae bacterium]